MTSPVQILSEGQLKNVHCRRGSQLTIVKEEGIVVFQVVSQGWVEDLSFAGIEDHLSCLPHKGLGSK